ncbi:MAG: DUF4276 family protein [bacterium]|nr:DUF4276 family protein [bacterium]
MKKILVLVEGQTEEVFVKNVLSPYFWDRQIFCIPKIAITKLVKSGPHFKGGIVSYEKVKNDIKRLLRDSSAVMVTTMIDYYGFASLVPFKNAIRGRSGFDRVRSLEELFRKDIDDDRFLPYLQLHEFESMVFVSPEAVVETLMKPGKKDEILKIKRKFTSPEEINDNPSSTPSKRLYKIFPDYEKVADGPVIVEKIGLKKIREECAHFNRWVTELEKL